MRALLFVLALAACSPQTEPAPPVEETPAPAADTAADDTAANLAQMPRWEAARDAGVDFRGVGQEPGWIMDIYGEPREGAIVLLWDYGEHVQQFPAATVTFPQDGVQHFETEADGHSLVVTIRRAPGEDAMSGEAYPSRVDVVVDGRALDGCGRSV
jgi:putative lipoprotein